MYYILVFIKHLGLFALANILASIAMFIYEPLSRGSEIYFDLGDVLFVSVFAMIFTIIPYLLSLLIIKINKRANSLGYILGGAVCSIPACLLITELAPILLLAGALIGFLYGVLDNILHIPNKVERR